MGRVFMCNETVLDECYLCLLAQVSFILEFSLLRWPRPWFLWIWRSCNRKLWSGPWRIQGRRSRISRLLCGVDPKGRKPFSQCSPAQANERGRAVGAQPCDSCGRWSSCWCEACEVAGLRPPTAICTSCDHAAIICERCREAGRTWEASQTAAAPGTIQVRGFVTAEGEWQAVHPPIEVTFEEVEGFEGETIEARVAAWAQATFDATTDGSGA